MQFAVYGEKKNKPYWYIYTTYFFLGILEMCSNYKQRSFKWGRPTPSFFLKKWVLWKSLFKQKISIFIEINVPSFSFFFNHGCSSVHATTPLLTFIVCPFAICATALCYPLPMHNMNWSWVKITKGNLDNSALTWACNVTVPSEWHVFQPWQLQTELQDYGLVGGHLRHTFILISTRFCLHVSEI